MQLKRLRFVVAVGGSMLIGGATFAQTPPATGLSQPQVVDLSKINRRVYGGQSLGNEIDVVQNRKYTNAGRFETAFLVGFSNGDPFLSIKNVGGMLGYHFNTFYSLHAVATQFVVSPSAASDKFAEINGGATAATNEPKSFYGLQLSGNFAYGKLSFIGKAIIYLDMYVFGGAGIMKTANGNSTAPFIGVGQRVHLDRHFGIKVEYRMLRYSEVLHTIDPDTDEPIDVNRTAVMDTVTLGLSYLF